MLNHFLKLTLLISILYSCQNSNLKNDEPENLNEDQVTANEESVNYTYLSNHEIEALIKTKDPVFMSSFWIGMTEDESIEIIRYLSDKMLIFGEIYNTDTQEYEPISKKNLKSGNFDKRGKTILCYLTPNKKQLKGEINLDFDDSSKGRILNMLTVSLTNDIEFSDFNDIIKIFVEKYGEPIRKSMTKPDNAIIPYGDTYRRYYFENGNKLIDITYNSEHEGVGGGFAPNQIHIMYQDKTVEDQKANEYKRRNEEQRKLENQILKENRKSTLENI